MKVIKVDPTSQASLQVISLDLETGMLGRSNQNDQQAWKLGYFQTRQLQLSGQYRLQGDFTGLKITLLSYHMGHSVLKISCFCYWIFWFLVTEYSVLVTEHSVRATENSIL